MLLNPNFRSHFFAHFLLIWGISLAITPGHTQSQKVEIKAPPSEIFSITIAPLALIDTYAGSSWRAGVRVRPTSMVVLSADYGTFFEGFSERFTLWRGLKGQNLRCQAMAYPFADKRYSVGLEYHYKDQNFFYHDSIPDEPKFIAHVDKRIQSLNAIGAFDHCLNDRLFLNFQLGVGIRHQNTVNSHSDTLSDSVEWWDSMSQIAIENADRLVPSFSAAIRLGYVLIQKSP